MKKKTIIWMLLFSLLLSLGQLAYADEYEGQQGWSVWFDEDDQMQSNFRTRDYNDPVAGLQPGDEITFTVHLDNRNESTTDWYMSNKVLHSLEDRSNVAAGGAYSYILSFYGTDEQRVLFSSDTVGGETIGPGGEGLHEATNALSEYFFLSTIPSGQSAVVQLTVALDGESQGNSYQDTLADLEMNFAVQKVGEDRPKFHGVETGDESHLILYFALSLISGVMCLLLAIYVFRWQKREKAGRKE